MIHRLEQAIQEAFLAVGDISPQGASAANEAMWHLLQSSAFNGSYQNHYLSVDGRGMKRLLYRLNDNERSADPVRQMMEEDEMLGNGAIHPNLAPATPDRVLEAAAAHETLVNRILHADPTLRRPPVIELFDAVGMRSFSGLMVGPGGDFSLSRFGIKYHQPSWTSQDMRYLVARTSLEVAGVLGISRPQHSPEALCLSYVSVNPGFQRQGVASELYGKFIDLAKREGRYVVRSNASENTPSAATARFDSILAEAEVVHVISGTYLEGAISAVYAAGFDASGHKKMIEASNAVAAARERMGRHGSDFSTFDHEQSVAVRGLVNAPSLVARVRALR